MRISYTKGETPSISKFTLKENQDTLGNRRFEKYIIEENHIMEILGLKNITEIQNSRDIFNHKME